MKSGASVPQSPTFARAAAAAPAVRTAIAAHDGVHPAAAGSRARAPSIAPTAALGLLPSGMSSTRAFEPLHVAVLTVSDTRTSDDDISGKVIADRLAEAGHRVGARAIVRDDEVVIRQQLVAWIDGSGIDAIVATGGTGLASRDVTPEALAPLITKPIPGFGELFRWLSFEEIGVSTIQSRAEAARCGDTFVFLLPGSPGAVKLAMDRLVLPQLDVRHRPCNLAELLPHASRS
jgi:molybdopterin adenylyltransferase